MFSDSFQNMLFKRLLNQISDLINPFPSTALNIEPIKLLLRTPYESLEKLFNANSLQKLLNKVVAS
jgi:hypothetical protein